MTTYYLNGTPIVEGSEITLSGFTYPYSWLEGTTASVRASLGIQKTGDITFDSKYYNADEQAKPLEDREEVDSNGDPMFVKVLSEVNGEPVMVDSEERLVHKGLKSNCTTEVKIKTNELLKSTDHYIIRGEVEGTEIPESVSTYRTAVIAEQDRVTTAIAAVTTVEELIEVMSSIAWPKAE